MRFLWIVVSVFAAGMCQAQSWPSKPVRIIVNVAAGGDGYIGVDAVARADADGYTLLYSPGSSVMIAPHIVNRPDLDPQTEVVL